MYDDSLGLTAGVTRASEGGWVIRVGPAGMTSASDALNTLAHELNHARDLIRNGYFLPTGIGEPIARAAGNAAEDWARGLL